jgi:DNA repair protein RecO (recombination protein O)
MPLIITRVIVLHAFDYLETSRVLRLITRDVGVQSVIAKGARRTKGRVGSGVDLFAEGEAQIYVKPTRDLHTLGALDITSSRTELAEDMARFTAASALAELTLRIAGDEPNVGMFDGLSAALDALRVARGDAIVERGLAGAWRLIADAGFAPALDDCAACHKQLPEDALLAFSHPAGGALCDDCARRSGAGRRIPASARDALRRWQRGEMVDDITAVEARAHQRLLREFIVQHVATGERPLRAFDAWETGIGSRSRATG